jgi:very-short-patch-repair endonuclease
VRRVNGIPVTCPARTLVDLASVTDDDQLQHALDKALNEGLLTIDVLERYIDARNLGHLKGVGRLKRYLRDRKKGAFGSGLERKFRRILKVRGIPQPDRQGGVEDYYVDFVFTKHQIFIEVDGDWHGTVAQLRKDDRRQNAIVLAGYTPLRFTEDRIDDEPDVVCADVEEALRAKGWKPRRRRSG